MPQNFSLGRRIRNLRERSRLTRAAVARACGIGSDELERIETGETDPGLGLIARICEAVDCTLVELLSLPPSAVECPVRILPAEAGGDPAAQDLLPVPLVSGEAAGGNARIVDESVLGWIFLPREEFGRRGGNLVAVRIHGRSMDPEIPDGAVVAVDRNDRRLTPEGIYALRDPDGGCTVKRVQVLDPSHVALVPSNRSEFKVEFWKLEPGETIEDRLIGRVVWLGFNLLEAERAAESQPGWGKGIRRASDLPPPEEKENKPF